VSSDCGQAPAFEELVDGLAGEEARVGIVKDAKAKIGRVEAARALSEGHAASSGQGGHPAVRYPRGRSHRPVLAVLLR
jgi:hypothetical protein